MQTFSRTAVVVSLFLAVGCGGSGSDGAGAPGCDQACAITNGATAAAGTTYWRTLDTGNCFTSPCAKFVAFFADGTGKLKSGANNCPNGAISGSVPVTTTFSYIQTGPGSIVLVGAHFACSLDPQPAAVDPFGSFTSITGGVTAGTFSASIGGSSVKTLSLVGGSL